MLGAPRQAHEFPHQKSIRKGFVASFGKSIRNFRNDRPPAGANGGTDWAIRSLKRGNSIVSPSLTKREQSAALVACRDYLCSPECQEFAGLAGLERQVYEESLSRVRCPVPLLLARTRRRLLRRLSRQLARSSVNPGMRSSGQHASFRDRPSAAVPSWNLSLGKPPFTLAQDGWILKITSSQSDQGLARFSTRFQKR
jgi:hypothetical protein